MGTPTPHRADAPVARVDHVANAVNGERSFGNVGRHNDLARRALGRLENLRRPECVGQSQTTTNRRTQ